MDKSGFDLDDVVHPGAVDFGKVLANWPLIQHFLDVLNGIRTMAPNAEIDLDTVEIRKGGKQYDWDMGSVKRIK